MEADRFDALTKALVATASRRRGVAALLGGLVAAAIPGLASDAKRRGHRHATKEHPQAHDERKHKGGKKRRKKKAPPPAPPTGTGPVSPPPPGDCTTRPEVQACTRDGVAVLITDLLACQPMCPRDPAAAACCENGEACCPAACATCVEAAFTRAADPIHDCGEYCRSGAAPQQASDPAGHVAAATCDQAEYEREKEQNKKDFWKCGVRKAFKCFYGNQIDCLDDWFEDKWDEVFDGCGKAMIEKSLVYEAKYGCPPCQQCIGIICLPDPPCRSPKVCRVAPDKTFKCLCPPDQNECGDKCCPAGQCCKDGRCVAGEQCGGNCCSADENCCQDQCITFEPRVCCDCSAWVNGLYEGTPVVSSCHVALMAADETTADKCHAECQLLIDSQPIQPGSSVSGILEPHRERGWVVYCDGENFCRWLCPQS
jgi:hypothetical protein